MHSIFLKVRYHSSTFFLIFSGHEQLACCFYYESIIGKFKEPCSNVSCPVQQVQYALSKVVITCSAWISHFQVPAGLCIKTRLSAQPFIWKWIFILMQIKLIYTRKIVHMASFWKRGLLQLGSGLLTPSFLWKGEGDWVEETFAKTTKTIVRGIGKCAYCWLVCPQFWSQEQLRDTLKFQFLSRF